MGLPEGVSLSMVLAVLIPVGIITIALRAVPFSIRRALGESRLIQLLGVTMPVGVMVVLVLYTLFGYQETNYGVVSGLIATALTITTHLLFRRALVSILTGTLSYMVLVNLIFV